MFTTKQASIIDRLSHADESPNAPHVSELAEALTRAFGGVDELAKMLADLAHDPKRPDWLRTRAASLVVNVVGQSSKLANEKPAANEFMGAKPEELKAILSMLLREILGIDATMDKELQTLITSWPELPQTTRSNIVAMVELATTPQQPQGENKGNEPT